MKKIKYIIVFKKINLRYKEVIKIKYIKFAKQINYKSIILNIINKIEILRFIIKI